MLVRVLPGIALLCAAVLVASPAHAQDDPPCGASAAIGSRVTWVGIVQDGYVTSSAAGQPRFLFVLACQGTTRRFAIRLDDINRLPPIGGARDGQALRLSAPLHLTGTLAASDTVRGSAGVPVSFLAVESARFAEARDSSEAAGAVERRRERGMGLRANVLLIIDGVTMQASDDPFATGRFEWLTIEQIEVLRGPAALLRYGPGAEGGAIVVSTSRTRS